jgi:hypothetical protein
LKIFDKNLTDKIQSKNYKGVNPPCLMAIRVKKASKNYKGVNPPCLMPIRVKNASKPQQEICLFLRKLNLKL